MPSLSRGLYLVEGSIKIDFMEDFFRVWLPIMRCLGLVDETDADGGNTASESDLHQGLPAEDEEGTREALRQHLVWLSNCKEIIQERLVTPKTRMNSSTVFWTPLGGTVLAKSSDRRYGPSLTATLTRRQISATEIRQ